MRGQNRRGTNSNIIFLVYSIRTYRTTFQKLEKLGVDSLFGDLIALIFDGRCPDMLETVLRVVKVGEMMMIAVKLPSRLGLGLPSKVEEACRHI